MRIFKEIRERLDSIESSLESIRQMLRPAGTGMDSTDAGILRTPSARRGRRTSEYVQIGSLLHGTGIRLSDFRAEAARDGWHSADNIRYDCLVDREEASDIIRRVAFRKAGRLTANPNQ